MPAFRVEDVMIDSVEEEGCIRVQTEHDIIKYIFIEPNTLGYKTLPARTTVAARLPELPPGDWTTVRLSRNKSNNQLELHSPERVEIPGVENLWHPVRVDCSDLELIRSITFEVFEATIRPGTLTPTPSLSSVVIVKMSGFPSTTWLWNRENEMYQRLKDKDLTPDFLGYVTENNGMANPRVIGFLVQKVEGHHALSLSDLPVCVAALRRLHAITGYCHGDPNRGIFLIKPDGSKALMIDFTFVHEGDEEFLQIEIETLEECMMEDDEERRRKGDDKYIEQYVKDRLGSVMPLTDDEDQRREQICWDAWIEEKYLTMDKPVPGL